MALLSSISDSKSVLIIQHNTNTENSLFKADSLNSKVTTSEIPLYNDKFINEMEQSYKKYGDSILIQNYSSILEIAQQCPYQGGRAVYRARYFIHLLNTDISYDDDEVCLSQGIQRLNHDEISSKFDFTLNPNPANEQVEVSLQHYIDEKIKIELINTIGEIIFEKENYLSSNHLMIDTKKYPAGFYQVKLFNNGVLVNAKKLILIK
jgi:hypothetical protein